jgi:hypothetical protein
MKRKIFTIAVAMLLSMTAFAQKTDGFFKNSNEETYNNRAEGIGIGGAEQEDPTPVGSGLLVLTLAGAGYVVLKNMEAKK